MALAITGGFIVDGTGGPGFMGDILLDGDRIVAVGNIGAYAGESVDAGGRIVCPGFIDLHRHGDLALFREEYGEIELSQGITTAVMGNCGMAPVPCRPESREGLLGYIKPCLGEYEADFPDYASYAEAIKAARPRTNIGFFAGLGAIRIAVKGFEATCFTRAELSAAQELLAQALDAGALGLSTGLIYMPETFGTKEEIAQIASVMRGRGMLCAHMRWETEQLIDGIDEVAAIANMAGVALHISHFKAAGGKAWRDGVMQKAIERIEKERARGMDITVDFYPYDCGASMLTQMIPPSLLSGDIRARVGELGTAAGVAKLRERLARGEPGWDNLAGSIGWSNIYITSANREENKRLVGRSVAESVEMFGYEDAPALVAAVLSSEGGDVANRNRSMRKEDIDAVAMLPYACVISDSLYGDMLNPHPRLFGAFPKFLREYAWERKLLAPEAAIHKMTGLPARQALIKDRGLLKPGAKADILVIDPIKFRDNATYDDPARLSSGPDMVFVNGEIAYRDKKLIDRAGEIILRA